MRSGSTKCSWAAGNGEAVEHEGCGGVYRFLGRVWRLFVDEQSETEFEQAATTAVAHDKCWKYSSSTGDQRRAAHSYAAEDVATRASKK